MTEANNAAAIKKEGGKKDATNAAADMARKIAKMERPKKPKVLKDKGSSLEKVEKTVSSHKDDVRRKRALKILGGQLDIREIHETCSFLTFYYGTH